MFNIIFIDILIYLNVLQNTWSLMKFNTKQDQCQILEFNLFRFMRYKIEVIYIKTLQFIFQFSQKGFQSE